MDYPSTLFIEASETLLEVEVWVHDSTVDLRYVVLMQRPTNTDQLSEAELVQLVKHDCMTGVAVSE